MASSCSQSSTRQGHGQAPTRLATPSLCVPDESILISKSCMPFVISFSPHIIKFVSDEQEGNRWIREKLGLEEGERLFRVSWLHVPLALFIISVGLRLTCGAGAAWVC